MIGRIVVGGDLVEQFARRRHLLPAERNDAGRDRVIHQSAKHCAAAHVEKSSYMISTVHFGPLSGSRIGCGIKLSYAAWR